MPVGFLPVGMVVTISPADFLNSLSIERINDTNGRKRFGNAGTEDSFDNGPDYYFVAG